MNKNFSNHYADEQLLFNHAAIDNPDPESYLPHSHDICELLLFKKGNVCYTTRGRQYHLQTDDLILSRPSEIHNIRPEKGVFYERYNILFDEKTLPFDIWKKLPQNTDVINLHHAYSVLELFEKMDYYRVRLSGAELKMMLTALAQEIFVNIVLETEAVKAENNYVQTNSTICAAISYIDEHMTTLTGIEEVASALFITKSHLHHLFMRHMNISPKKYIVTKRLAFARRKISAGVKPTEVYSACGFTDYSAFYRAYRNHFGKCPSDKTDSTTLTMNGITHYHNSDE